MNKFSINQTGFTLLEMIVSIAILSILAIFLLTTVNPVEQYQKAQDARRKSDLSQLQKAFEAYYQDKGRYPNSTNEYYIESDDPGNAKINWGESFKPYMEKLPADSGEKRYIYVSTGQSYWIYASLDRGTKDSQVCNGGLACTGGIPNGVLCSKTANSADVCNYGVSSPNVSP